MHLTFFRGRGRSLPTLRNIASALGELGHETRIHAHGQPFDQSIVSDKYVRWGWHGFIPTMERTIESGKGLSKKYVRERVIGSPPMMGFDPMRTRFQEGVKYIARPPRHEKGQDCIIFTGSPSFEVRAQLRMLRGPCPYEACYISEFIDKVKEYRVCVYNNRVYALYEKIPSDPTQDVWNFGTGAVSKNVKWGSWPLDVATMAVKACVEIGCCHGAVDIMVDKDGCPYFLEINGAPEMNSPYRCMCLAKSLVHEGPALYIPSSDFLSWKSAIHPALLEK